MIHLTRLFYHKLSVNKDCDEWSYLQLLFWYFCSLLSNSYDKKCLLVMKDNTSDLCQPLPTLITYHIFNGMCYVLTAAHTHTQSLTHTRTHMRYTTKSDAHISHSTHSHTFMHLDIYIFYANLIMLLKWTSIRLKSLPYLTMQSILQMRISRITVNAPFPSWGVVLEVVINSINNK